MSAPLEGERLPLRSVLGTPLSCLDAALVLAGRAEALSDFRLAETLLRGVCALDASYPGAAEALARVLLAAGLSRGDALRLEQAEAWCAFALGLEPTSASRSSLLSRCRRARRASGR